MTNRLKAPLTYREDRQRKPIKKGRNEPLRQPIRIAICQKCRQPGGTFENIGTHKEPRYIHPGCRLGARR